MDERPQTAQGKRRPLSLGGLLRRTATADSLHASENRYKFDILFI
jgi:hypothetical protein